MLTAATSSPIAFPSVATTCLVLADWLGISLQSHQGQRDTRMAMGMLLFAECRLQAKPAGK